MKYLSILSLLLALGLVSQAAGIRQGNMFFDGFHTLSAEIRHGGIVYLTDGDMEITLQPAKGKPNMYQLIPSRQAEEPPYGLQWNARAEYISDTNGAALLAFYIDEYTAVQALADISRNTKYATDITVPDADFHLSRVLNQTYLSSKTPDQLQVMINQLNAMPKKSRMQEVNAQMISYFITAGGSTLEGNTEDDDFDGDTDFVPTENGRSVWYAHNGTDIISGFEDNVIISIGSGTTINLTATLLDAGLFTGIEGRDWVENIEEYTNDRPCVISEKVYDGRQLKLMNFDNVTIRGEGQGATLLIDPRYANLLNFFNCNGLTIENLTIGHTETGDCYGGVLYLSQCTDVTIRNCDLFGCGLLGIEANNCHDINVENTVIRDCKDGIIQLNACVNTTFTGCDFYRNSGGDLTEINEECAHTTFRNCRFAQNRGALLAAQTPTQIVSCQIHHNADDLYINNPFTRIDNLTTIDDSDSPLEPRR